MTINMGRVHRTAALAIHATVALLMLAGCNESGQGDGTTERPAAAAPTDQPSNQEQAALDSFVDSKTPGRRTAAPPSATAGTAALPAGHPPVGGVSTDLKFDAPTSWKSQPPTSSMRKAQYILPRVEGDNADGELVVFYFGPGQGGDVQSNLARWRSQFTTADGQPLPDSAVVVEPFESHGLKVTLIDLAGRFAPAPMPGMPATAPQDDYRMLGAVVETSSGPWFFKAVGPTATMVHHREDFKRFLSTVRE